MITFLDGEDEEAIALVDAGGGQPGEELAESLVGGRKCSRLQD